MSGVVSAVMGALIKAREAMMFPCISSSVSAVMAERRGGGPRLSEYPAVTMYWSLFTGESPRLENVS